LDYFDFDDRSTLCTMVAVRSFPASGPKDLPMEWHLIAELEENYDRFVARSLAGGSVWCLDCAEGLLAVTAHNGEQRVIPVWSDAAYARRALIEAPPNGYAVKAIPLQTFLNQTLGNFQCDDALIGPNYTRDMAGVELDPRDMFEEFRSRMTEQQSEDYRQCLATASIVTMGHPVEKLKRRVERFGRIVAFDPNASPSTLVRGDDPVHIDNRSKPGSSFVPLWSSGTQAERARRFCFAPDDPVRVVSVKLDEFLASAERDHWSIGVDPTIGLACMDIRAGDLLALVNEAQARADEESDDEA
jgi:Protein of unknown function (DUF2750)